MRAGALKSVYLEQTVGLPAPVQTARHSTRVCCIWPARDCLHLNLICLDTLRIPVIAAAPTGGCEEVWIGDKNLSKCVYVPNTVVLNH